MLEHHTNGNPAKEKASFCSARPPLSITMEFYDFLNGVIFMWSSALAGRFTSTPSPSFTGREGFYHDEIFDNSAQALQQDGDDGTIEASHDTVRIGTLPCSWELAARHSSCNSFSVSNCDEGHLLSTLKDRKPTSRLGGLWSSVRLSVCLVQVRLSSHPSMECVHH